MPVKAANARPEGTKVFRDALSAISERGHSQCRVEAPIYAIASNRDIATRIERSTRVAQLVCSVS